MDFISKVFITLFSEELKVFLPLIFLFLYSIFTFKEKKNWSKIKKFIVLLLPFLFIFYHYSYLSNFFSAIGQDSLLEINADLGEAIFYIKTFITFLFDPEIFKRNRFWLLLGSSTISAIILYYSVDFFCKKKRINILIFNKFFNLLFFAAFILAIFSIINVVKINLNIGKELRIVENKFNKNILNFNAKRISDNKLKAVIYIGESTTALNLSSYGYPFKTTPWLKSQEENEKLIKFNKVFSTHTHTTPSLQSILSLCIKQNKKDCSLILDDLENNLSIVDIFSKLDINTHLFSTQGFLGGHNLATKLVLNTKEKYFSSEYEGRNVEFRGNRYIPKIKDKEFFLDSYCKKDQIFKDQSSLVFLHSYAGHGQYAGYLNHIPEKKVFNYPKYINKSNFLGKGSRNFRLIQEYDAAVKYIDDSLKSVVECSINKSEKESQPLIFIYFADHGEAVASARGHDSSRLTYEMLHVPFFIIFNETAYNLYEDKFKTLNNLANNNLSLKFLSDVLIYLFDINVLDAANQNTVYAYDEFKSLSSDFILDRKDLNGEIKKIQTFWNFEGNLENSELTETQFNNQDTSISLWQLNNYLEKKGLSDKKNIKNLVCQHRANSYIIQYKSSLSNGCFETDIHYLEDYAISTHETENHPSLIFDKFLESNYNKNVVWLDSKNLSLIKNCKLGNKWLQKNHQNFLSLLVETPSDSINNIDNKEWINCIKEINSIRNINVGYYLPTKLVTECSQKPIGEKKVISAKCEKFYYNTINFLEKTDINSITFDYAGYEFVKKMEKFENYKWHIWHVDSLRSFNKIFENGNIGIVLLKNNRFTDNLN